ncbi:MAG: triacylglycerol lipase [Oscillospiraceae bacterium]|nr:triacylglycerol lipase [Oscillospiraceae bacterium]
MIYLKRIGFYIVLFPCLNLFWVVYPLDSLLLRFLICMCLGTLFVLLNIFPIHRKTNDKGQKYTSCGFELTLAALIIASVNVVFYISLFLRVEEASRIPAIVSACMCFFLTLIMLVNGVLRLFVTAKQPGVVLKILVFAFWWVPILNLVLLFLIMKKVYREMEFNEYRYLLNTERRDERLCETKYPLYMVHGVFFRDWQNFNYWGRIPGELIKNGAKIYYGNHQSAASVEQSAEELKQGLLKIIEETNCEKVNIIAHSKGGIDARYMISMLGMGKYTASLTTINTPHYGCKFVSRILEKTSQKTLSLVGSGYEKIFSKLGDDNPDFYGSLLPLTDESCARWNEILKDDENVLYQSTGSMMKTPFGSIPPLILGYNLIKKHEGDNDGLVSVKSMVWGDFLGVAVPKGNEGISHGDVIDLTKKNIDGFDVCEFYIDLVNKLRLKGL